MQSLRNRGLTKSLGRKSDKEKRRSQSDSMNHLTPTTSVEKAQLVDTDERIIQSILRFDPFNTQIPPLVLETTAYLEIHGLSIQIFNDLATRTNSN